VSDDLPLPKLPPVDPSAADVVPGADLSPELLAGLLADGDDELAAWTLSHAMRQATRAEVFDGLLRDAMRLVGERWVNGQWGIAEEHLASRTLLRALERVRPQLGPEARIGPVAVLAGVAGEHHMIGLVCLEQVLAEAGWTTANLGADLPAQDLGRFVARNDVTLVALSAVDPARLGALADAVDAARAAGGESLRVMVGGQLAERPGVRPATQVDWAGSSLVEAAAFAATAFPDEDPARV
jgi:methanogenic corrinoid protein MtbC1